MIPVVFLYRNPAEKHVETVGSGGGEIAPENLRQYAVDEAVELDEWEH